MTNSNISMLAVPTPSSLMLTSSPEAVLFGSDVTLTCTLGLNSAIVASDLPLLMVDIQLSRDGMSLSDPTQPSVTDITFTRTSQLDSFGITNVGNYSCNATVRSSSPYLTGNEVLQSNTSEVTTGKIFP